MTWRSLHQILGSVQSQPTWQQRQHFLHLRRHWIEVVGPVVAAQTRPIAIQDKTLKVATSSAMWAQTLMFERQRILAKLNQQLAADLTDIRFSTAQWYDASPTSANSGDERELHQHPSHCDATSAERSRSPRPTDPTTAFQRWAEEVRSRAKTLPLCPRCQCPTPDGELRRWKTCALCAAKSWAAPPPNP